MEKNKTEVKLNPTEKSETLWENFEKTGSIKAFLLFSQKAEILNEDDFFQSPTR